MAQLKQMKLPSYVLDVMFMEITVLFHRMHCGYQLHSTRILDVTFLPPVIS